MQVSQTLEIKIRERPAPTFERVALQRQWRA
jgi:hypothetical protein